MSSKYPYDNNYKDLVYNNKKLFESINIFNEEYKELAKTISLDNSDKYLLRYGSGAYKATRNYSGDLDIWELVTDMKISYEEFSRKLKETIKRIVKSKKVFFLESKIGLDYNNILDIGYYENLEIKDYDYEKILDCIKKNKNLKSLKDLVKLNPTVDEWFTLYEESRKLYILRWQIKDILKGKLKMDNGKEKDLIEALKDKTTIKIDTLALYNYKFIGMDNFLDTGLNTVDRFKVSLSMSMIKFYQDQNYYKYIARLYALIKTYYPNEEDKMINIWLFMTSGYGGIRKVKNEVKYILEFLQLKKLKLTIDEKKIIFESIDSIINKLSSIKGISNEFIKRIADDLYKLQYILVKNTEKDLEKELIRINEYILEWLNSETKKYSIKNGLYPLEKKFLMFSSSGVMMYEYINKK